MDPRPETRPDRADEAQGGASSLAATIAKRALQAPVHAYRWTLKPLIGWECRHLPTCSEYALDAIDINGAWRGGWLALSRICRCHPWGTSGFDPAPDIRTARHRLAPWRYGRWREVGAPHVAASDEALHPATAHAPHGDHNRVSCRPMAESDHGGTANQRRVSGSGSGSRPIGTGDGA